MAKISDANRCGADALVTTAASREERHRIATSSMSSTLNVVGASERVRRRAFAPDD
jgi:hypothetical protein